MKKIMTIRKPSEFEIQICPYCVEKLNGTEIIKRKLLKKCKCSKCKRIINEKCMHY